MKVTVKYHCDDETCFASIRLPINEDVSDYGWSHAKITVYYWILCPKHNPNILESELIKNALAKIGMSIHVPNI